MDRKVVQLVTERWKLSDLFTFFITIISVECKYPNVVLLSYILNNDSFNDRRIVPI